jgi:PIN domain nuclease of toxin-antitoxin system
MRLLIDTHVFVWASIQPELLSQAAADAVANPDNLVLVSAVSAYEIELKRERDAALARMPADLAIAAAEQRFSWLTLAPRHAAEAGRLPKLHGDPFDRMIIAQAKIENATIVTKDKWFPAYGAPVLW